jgi:hypothetical protein
LFYFRNTLQQIRRAVIAAVLRQLIFLKRFLGPLASRARERNVENKSAANDTNLTNEKR